MLKNIVTHVSKKLISIRRYSAQNVNVRNRESWSSVNFQSGAHYGSLHNFSAQKGKPSEYQWELGTDRSRDVAARQRDARKVWAKGPSSCKISKAQRGNWKVLYENKNVSTAPGITTHPGTRFSNLILKRFVARDRNKRRARFLIYST